MKKKINIIDIAVVVLLVALLTVLYLKVNTYSSTKADSQMNTIEYSVKVSNIRQYSVDAFKIGDIVYDSQTKLAIGTIKDIQVAKANNIVETTDGRVLNVESLDKYDVLITIQTDGLETDNAFFADRSVELKVGSEKVIETLYIKATCMIMGIETVEEK